MKLMMRILLLALAAGLCQDPAAGDEEAKAILKDYKEKRKNARKAEEISAALSLLNKADPHPLIRAELVSQLESHLPPALRFPVAEALGRYSKDRRACDALIRLAREDRGKERFDLRKRCLRSFAEIAPFGRSTDLLALFYDPDPAIARAAVDAARRIASVRMLGPLVELLGELERIRDGDPGDCGPDQRAGDDPKRRRRRELIEPIREAMQRIWMKVGVKGRLLNYTDASRLLAERREDLRRVRMEEDKRDRNR